MPDAVASANATTPEDAEMLSLLDEARNDLLFYIKACDPKFIVSKAHVFLAKKLQDVAEGRCKRLIISTPPRIGKSRTCCIEFPSWLMGRDPTQNIVVGSYAQSLANIHSRSTRQRIQENEIYRLIFPNTKVNDGDARMDDWGTREGGRYKSVGVGSGITGRGATTLILDDLVKDFQEANSQIVQDGIWDWLQSTALTRLAPGAPVILIMTRWSCLSPDTKITTERGLIPIRDSIAGESVLTSHGMQPIKRKVVSKHTGEVKKFSVYGFPEEITVTPDHQIFTKEGWKQAKDVLPTDRMVLKIDDAPETSIEYLKSLWPSLSVKTHKQHPWATKIPREELKSLLDAGKTYDECAAHFHLPGGKGSILPYITNYGFNRDNRQHIDSSIVEDPEFWRVVGYWIAEGYTTTGRWNDRKTRVQFSFHALEAEYHNDIKRIMGKYGIPVTLKKNSKNCIVVCFSSLQMAQFLSGFGNSALNKKLPLWAQRLPDEFIRQMFDGWWRGDGCDVKNFLRVGSSSLDLHTTFQSALLRIGVVSSIMKASVGYRQTMICGQMCNSGPSWEIRVHKSEVPWMLHESPPRRHRLSEIIDGNLISLIKSIKTDSYDGEVIDIETDCHDFVCGTSTVHNCTDPVGRILSPEFQSRLKDAGVEGADAWEIVNLPAICDESDDLLGRELGESVFPERFSANDFKKIRAERGSFVWSSLYCGRPTVRGGNYIKTDKIKVVQPSDVPKDLRMFRFWDLATSEKKTADYTVGILGGLDHLSGIFYIVDVIRGKWEWPTARDRIKMAAIKDKVRIGVEAVAGFKTAFSNLVEVMPPHISCTEFGADKDKMTRALPWIAMAENGRMAIVQGDWNIDLLMELEAFPRGANDDQVDGVAGVYQMAANNIQYIMPSNSPKRFGQSDRGNRSIIG